MTTPLGARLVAFSDLAVCDTKYEHEVRLVTDGTTAYAYAVHHGATDCPLVTRDGATMTVQCGQNTGPGEDGEPCHGEATFRLDTEGAWTADPEALDLLAKYGERVES